MYRREEQFERLDIYLPRCTMERWVVKSAQTCRGLWNALEERLMNSPYLACDETPTQVFPVAGTAVLSS